MEVVEDCLKNDYGIPPEQIKRATGEDNQIEGLDLLAPGDVRYIITVQALREGWDCPFAYVLCSVAEQYGATAVEQIIGRVLRMPKAQRKGALRTRTWPMPLWLPTTLPKRCPNSKTPCLKTASRNRKWMK